MSTQLTVTREITLVSKRCGECDITFAVPDYFDEECRQTGRSWFCPNGHGRIYRESDNQKLRKEMERLRANNTHLRDQRDATERSNRALRGQITKARKRVGNGVCPCCNRSFQNLARHMAGQHPEYAEATS